MREGVRWPPWLYESYLSLMEISFWILYLLFGLFLHWVSDLNNLSQFHFSRCQVSVFIWFPSVARACTHSRASSPVSVYCLRFGLVRYWAPRHWFWCWVQFVFCSSSVLLSRNQFLLPRIFPSRSCSPVALSDPFSYRGIVSNAGEGLCSKKFVPPSLDSLVCTELAEPDSLSPAEKLVYQLVSEPHGISSQRRAAETSWFTRRSLAHRLVSVCAPALVLPRWFLLALVICAHSDFVFGFHCRLNWFYRRFHFWFLWHA
jgi:hypothetical protein